MGRFFAYARVSTIEQLTENQKEQIAQAGYKIEARRYIEEKISGSVPAMNRPGFTKLMDRLEAGDTVVVTKLDRLGRDNIDVQQTVQLFQHAEVRLVVLQLGNLDLTSSAGELMVKLLAAVADFERDLIIERTQAGLARAKAEGKRLGRPPITTQEQQREILNAISYGESISAVSRRHKISRALVHKILRQNTRAELITRNA